MIVLLEEILHFSIIDFIICRRHPLRDLTRLSSDWLKANRMQMVLLLMRM
jgi:hypothetical protein